MSLRIGVQRLAEIFNDIIDIVGVADRQAHRTSIYANGLQGDVVIHEVREDGALLHQSLWSAKIRCHVWDAKPINEGCAFSLRAFQLKCDDTAVAMQVALT